MDSARLRNRRRSYADANRARLKFTLVSRNDKVDTTFGLES
jgi:hypothetical protein